MRGMQNAKRKLTGEQALEVLKRGEFGVLSTVCDDGLPYGVPLKYAMNGSYTVYFHGATAGQKLDNLKHNDRVCLTVVPTATVDSDRVTTRFESVMAFGTAAIVTEEAEKKQALNLLLERFSPMNEQQAADYIDRYLNDVAVIRMEIEYLSGKANR